MNFANAINVCINEKKRIARAGWNGPAQYLVDRAGYPQGVAIDAKTAQEMGKQAGEIIVFGAYVVIVAVDGSVHPWTPSQGDMHACDWEVV